jgi:Tol biopolymer transport system component
MQRTRNARRRLLVAGAASILTALVGTGAAASRRAPAADPAVPGDGTNTTSVAKPPISQTPSISADGQWLVYAGLPNPPATGTDARTSTVFLQNRADGSVSELTTLVDGLRPGNSVMPVISADGCNVAVITEMAYDLFRDDDQGDRWDVYSMRLPHCQNLLTGSAKRHQQGTFGEWQLVSTGLGSGLQASASDDVSPLYPPAMSGEGATVAYTERFDSSAADLTTVTLVDLTVPIGTPGRSQAVAGTPSDPPDSTFRYRGVRQPSISEDGTIVAFTSDADNSTLLNDWGTGPTPGDFATSHVFVWDRTNPDRNTNVRKISAANTESAGADSPAVSGDGRVVAFVSVATNLVPGATLPACNPKCFPEVYLWNRTDGSIQLGSRAPGDPSQPPVAADLGATQPVLSKSGDELVYVSRATNLFPTRSGRVGAASDGDIVLQMPATGTVVRVTSVFNGLIAGPAANAHPRVTDNGRIVVFDSLAGSAYGGRPVDGRQVGVRELKPSLTLANLDVGTVAVGFPGPEWFLVLANNGPSSFIPADVSVDSKDFIVSGGSCKDKAGVPVPAGGVCTINLMMQPSKEGTAKTVLTVHEDGFHGVDVTATITGTGGVPALQPDPGGAEAHPMVVGARDEPLTFKIQNVAFTPVKIAAVRVQGANPADFVIADNSCAGKTLAAAGTCTIDVVFAPTAGGRRTASVVVRSVDGAYTTMIVSGDARWDPKIAVSNTVVIAPTKFQVVGNGFPPNTPVLLSWSDGLGRAVVATTDATGALLADLTVRPNDRPGSRRIVAQTIGGEVATADVTVVVPRRSSPVGTPRWPHQP